MTRDETMIVSIPLPIALRVVRFLNEAAGEGIYFVRGSSLYELDAASILLDWFGEIPPNWVPQDIKDAW